MKTPKLLAALAGTAAIVAVGALWATGDSAPAGADEQLETHQLSGYPLDRGLDALVADPDAEQILVLEETTSKKAVDVTPAPSDGNESAPTTVVTPVTGTITEVLRGNLKRGTDTTFPVLGGTAGKIQVKAGKELAPDLADVTGPSRLILIAGRTSSNAELGGTFVDPSFVYEIDESGKVTSLLESAGDTAYPSFTLAELKQALSRN